MIEIVSPGTKDKRGANRNFVEKTVDFIEAGVHVFVIDLFLTPQLHVRVPLETTYEATWNVLPQQLRSAVMTGNLPMT